MSEVDRGRQKATKRRLKRLRFERRWGNLVFWGSAGAVALVTAFGILNHYELSRRTIELTVQETYFSRPGGEVRYSMRDSEGKAYEIGGFRARRTYERLSGPPGRRFQCDVRGIDLEIPLLPDFRPEITNCEALT